MSVFIVGSILAVRCPKGAMVIRCDDCIAGTYAGSAVAANRQEDCVNCPAGTYSGVKGLMNRFDCEPCLPGKYSEQAAQTTDVCIACSAGKWSLVSRLDVAHKCIKCSAGTWSDSTEGLTSPHQCYNCTTGKYNDKRGQSTDVCIECAAGKWSSATGVDAPSKCIDCVSGKWSNATGVNDTARCIDCKAGKYFDLAAQTADVCVDCVAGKWSSKPGNSIAEMCIDCVAGRYFEQAAQISDVCQNCTAGRYTGLRRVFDGDSFVNKEITGVDNHTKCKVCGSGKFSTTIGAVLISTCVKCKAGKWSSATGMDTPSKCIDCVAGRYSSSTGANAASTCIACAAGMYSSSTGVDDVSKCIACVPGKYFIEAAQSSDVCIGCAAGKWSPGSGVDVASECIDCTAGKYFTQVAQSSDVCISCVAGKYFAQAGQSSDVCIECAVGTWSSTSGVDLASRCIPCNPGKYNIVAGSNASSACTPCASGLYSTTPSANSSSVCLGCPAGMYSDETGQTTSRACRKCSGLTFQPSEAQTSCISCPLGKFTYTFDCDFVDGNTCIINHDKMAVQVAKGNEEGEERFEVRPKWNQDIRTMVEAGLIDHCSLHYTYACTRSPTWDDAYWKGRDGKYHGWQDIPSCAYSQHKKAIQCKCDTQAESGSTTEMTGVLTSQTYGLAAFPPVFFRHKLLIAKFDHANQQLTLAEGKARVGPLQCKLKLYNNETDQRSCIACVAGKWWSSITAQCVECSVGRFSVAIASTTISTCKICSAGKSVSTAGSTECYSCIAGKYSSNNDTSCVSCGRGKYSNTFTAKASTACVTCTAGQASSHGATACAACAMGEYVPASRAGCFTCANSSSCPALVTGYTWDCRTVFEPHPYFRDKHGNCSKCPKSQLTLLLTVTGCYIGLIIFVGLGWNAATKIHSRKDVVSLATTNIVIHTLQVIQLTTDGVELPPILRKSVTILGAVVFQIEAARPECTLELDLAGKAVFVLYGVPLVLMAGYIVLMAWQALSFHELRYLGITMLANIYWAWVTLLHWTWKWAACRLNGDKYTMVSEDSIRCSLEDPAWIRYMVIAAPGIIAYQVVVPWSMVRLAGTHKVLNFATEAYREDWKGRWLSVELGYKTVIVLVKTFLTLLSPVARNLIVLVLVVLYHVALLWYRPYLDEVSLHADGALFYTFLLSGITQGSLILATLVFTDAKTEGTTHAALMQAFVLSILIFWFILVLWLAYQYLPVSLIRPSLGGDIDREAYMLTRKFKHSRAQHRAKRMWNRYIVYGCQLLTIALGVLMGVVGSPLAIAVGVFVVCVSAGSFFLRHRLFRKLEVLFSQQELLNDGAFISHLMEATTAEVKPGDYYFVPLLKENTEYDRNDYRRCYQPGKIVKIDDDSIWVRSSKTDEDPVRVDFKNSSMSSEALVAMARSKLRLVEWPSLSEGLFTSSFWNLSLDQKKRRSKKIQKLGRPLDDQETSIDFYVSHSWHDDGQAKYRALQQVAEEFEQQHGRPPTFWLDAICLDQADIIGSFCVLPLNISKCKKVLVLWGESYVKRLWCIWELYCIFATSIAGSPAEAAERVHLQIATKDGAMIDVPSELENFKVTAASCFDPNEQHKISTVIKQGGEAHFEKLIHEVGHAIRGQRHEQRSPFLSRQLPSTSKQLHVSSKQPHAKQRWKAAYNVLRAVGTRHQNDAQRKEQKTGKRKVERAQRKVNPVQIEVVSAAYAKSIREQFADAEEARNATLRMQRHQSAVRTRNKLRARQRRRGSVGVKHDENHFLRPSENESIDEIIGDMKESLVKGEAQRDHALHQARMASYMRTQDKLARRALSRAKELSTKAHDEQSGQAIAFAGPTPRKRSTVTPLPGRPSPDAEPVKPPAQTWILAAQHTIDMLQKARVCNLKGGNAKLNGITGVVVGIVEGKEAYELRQDKTGRSIKLLKENLEILVDADSVEAEQADAAGPDEPLTRDAIMAKLLAAPAATPAATPKRTMPLPLEDDDGGPSSERSQSVAELSFSQGSSISLRDVAMLSALLTVMLIILLGALSHLHAQQFREK